MNSETLIALGIAAVAAFVVVRMLMPAGSVKTANRVHDDEYYFADEA